MDPNAEFAVVRMKVKTTDELADAGVLPTAPPENFAAVVVSLP